MNFTGFRLAGHEFQKTFVAGLQEVSATCKQDTLWCTVTPILLGSADREAVDRKAHLRR